MDPALARTFATLAWGALLVYWYAASLGASRHTQGERGAASFVHLALFATAFALAVWPMLDTSIRTLHAPVTGLAVQLAGLALAVWARATLGTHWSGTVTIQEGHALVTRGPYAAVRHPIYTGLLVAFAGSALVVGDLRGWIALGAAAIAVAIRIPREERAMERAFGEAWRRYRARVRGAIVPRMKGQG